MSTTPGESYSLRPRGSRSSGLKISPNFRFDNQLNNSRSKGDTTDNHKLPQTGSGSGNSHPLKLNDLHRSQLTDTPKRTVLQRHLLKHIEGHSHKKTETPGEQYSTPVGRPDVDASFRTEDKVSPMLAKLRMTPGTLLKETQSILKRKHDESRRRIDKVNVGGGVSLWPQMESMRLTSDDVRQLVIICCTLFGLVVCLFYILHGSTVKKLLQLQRDVSQFRHQFTIDTMHGQVHLDQSLIDWHINYKSLVDSIHEEFDVRKVPLSYFVYISLYMATVSVLFYYLIDNMFAKSKLSPNRIRRWVCLLTVTGSWTLLMLVSLAISLWTEVAIETNIHLLSAQLADVIPTKLSCDKFTTILQYWRTRCLPPSSHGTISIFGLMPVRDLTFYLQYYSIPIITVLLTPVFKLVVAVMTVYNIGTKKTE